MLTSFNNNSSSPEVSATVPMETANCMTTETPFSSGSECSTGPSSEVVHPYENILALSCEPRKPVYLDTSEVVQQPHQYWAIIV